MSDPNAIWEYGNCNLGVPASDFFLNENGWDFNVLGAAVNIGCSPKICPGCIANECSGDSATSPAPGGESVSAPRMDGALGDPENRIMLSDPGQLHVAILSNADFYAPAVVPSSPEFEGATPAAWWSNAEVSPPAQIWDVNGDGYADVVASFPVQNMVDLKLGDTEATLIGTFLGESFSITSRVTVLP